MSVSHRSTRSLSALAAVSLLAVAGLSPSAMARNGADDPAGHNAGDDNGGKVVTAHAARRHHARKHVRVHAARHGADDPVGDDRGNDGANHL